MTNPINLDALGSRDLEAIEMNASAHEAVRNYAGMKREAMVCRKRGQTGKATLIERHLRGKYLRDIPEGLRW